MCVDSTSTSTDKLAVAKENTLSTLINVGSLMPRRVRHFCNFVSKGALMSRRALMSSARKFCRPRENFSKGRSGRRDQNRPRIVKIGAVLAIFEPFEVLRHFLANSADRLGIYIETLYKTNFPREVCLNSVKSGR